MLDDIKILSAITATEGAAGSSDVEGAIVDMQQYQARGILMIATFGAIVSGAATSIKAQQGAASDMSDGADLAGTSQTVADDKDGKVFAIDLRRPKERYVRLIAKRATQNSTVSATYVLYDLRRKGTPSVTGGLERFESPDEGTA